MQRSKQSSSLQNKPQPIHSHFSQFNIPQSQSSSQQHLQVIQHQPAHSTIFQPPTPAQMIPNNQRPITSTHVIAAPFEPPQYLNAIPLQPVFSGTAVISSAQATPDFSQTNAMMSPAQNQIQSQLQRKHEELQKLIVQQQDELRRVSEQLFMARYGIIPSVVNVSIPFPIPMDQSELGECSRANSTSSQVTNTSFHEQHPLMHHSQITIPNQLHPQIHVHPPSQNQILTHSQINPGRFEMAPKSIIGENTSDADRETEDIMQYMQHQSLSQVMPQQQIVTSDAFELMPFQMMNTQAQILFSSGNPTEGNSSNNPSSKK